MCFECVQSLVPKPPSKWLLRGIIFKIFWSINQFKNTVEEEQLVNTSLP